MSKPLSILSSVAIGIVALAPGASAAVNVERQGAENPFIEVVKTMEYGALGGLVLGGAIAMATEDGQNDGDIIRWSIVGGTFLGLGYGVYHVSRRPPPTAMIELADGKLCLQAPMPMPAPGRGVTVRLVGVEF